MILTDQIPECIPAATLLSAVDGGTLRESLSGDEENRLARMIALGDKQARNRLIQSNLRLVTKIAREFLGRGLPLDDLVGEGNLGLIKAAEQFDPSFGTRFSTYARFRIKEAIQSALINTAATIRVPSHMVKLLIKWRRAERAYYRNSGRLPKLEELSSVLGLSEVQMEMLVKARHATQFRLEGGTAGAGTGFSVDETIISRETPGAAIEADEEWNRLLSRMERLDAREYVIVSLRFGLSGEPPRTLQQIADRLELNKEWIRKILTRAIRKLDEACPVRPTTPRAAAKCRVAATRQEFDKRCHPFRQSSNRPAGTRDGSWDHANA
jgi:RNA polymerase primary sigma factor